MLVPLLFMKKKSEVFHLGFMFYTEVHKASMCVRDIF